MRSVAASPSPWAGSPLQMAAGALDLLDREDPAELSSVALGEQIEELFTIQNRVAAAITRRVAVFDRTRGCAAFEAHSTAAWLKRGSGWGRPPPPRPSAPPASPAPLPAPAGP